MSVKDQRINWASRVRVDAYRDRAAQNLKFADIEQVRNVRERYLKIAHHYLEVADSLEQSAKQKALCRAPSDHHQSQFSSMPRFSGDPGFFTFIQQSARPKR
jgi:hypothetical protein